MIQIRGLSKSYGSHLLFDDISFTVNDGERIGLVGRNGHGKTTLLRIITGEESPDLGTIDFSDNYRVGYLSQHIRFTMESVLKEACLNIPHMDEGKDVSYKGETILMGLGFSKHDFNDNPLELSGGFQVRLTLAKVLLSDPDILLLDEPTNYLDIVSLRWLALFLRTWKKELILITHDRGFMDSVTTHTIAIHRCKTKKVEGTTDKVYRQLLMVEEVYEKTRMNDEKKRRELERFIDRFRAKATKARAVQSKVKALNRKEQLEELSEIRNLEFTFNSAPFTGKQYMEVKELSFGYNRDDPLLIERLSFFIGRNDRIGIVGKNGKGKTTLLKLLAGELNPLSGEVNHHAHLKPAYFGQTNIARLNPEKSVEEEIMDIHPEHSRGAVRGICGAMMFPGENALKKISVLSGGEKSRVLLGKLLVSPANLLLLDEPTNHLDMESTESLLDAVNEFGGAVVIVTHSEMILRALVTRLIVFDNEKVTLFEGSYVDFLDRVGWTDNFDMDQQKSQKGDSTDKAVNRKLQRRQKAELVNEKSRTLNALQNNIDKIEDEITTLEQNIEDENSALLDASIKGDGATIKLASKTIHEAKSRIETLFSELELLYTELEEKRREFEERLNDLENPDQAHGIKPLPGKGSPNMILTTDYSDSHRLRKK